LGERIAFGAIIDEGIRPVAGKAVCVIIGLAKELADCQCTFASLFERSHN
jgi:hypothetical protein